MSGDVSVNLVTTIIDNIDDPGWQAYAVVINLEDRRVSTITGYVYMPDGEAKPAILTILPIEGAIFEYLDAHYAPDEAWPVQLLVQFDDAAGGYEVTFEDTDPDHWKVDPDDPYTLREAIRPDFSED